VTFWAVNWLRAFALTLIMEVLVAVPLLAPAEPRLARRTAVVAVANLSTHPLVWFLFPGLTLSSCARLAISEVWAVTAELAIYLLVWPVLRFRRAASVSLAANGASFLLGLVGARLLGTP
jgi:hypothetical protein